MQQSFSILRFRVIAGCSYRGRDWVVGRGREKGEKAAEMARKRREQGNKEGDEDQPGFIGRVRG